MYLVKIMKNIQLRHIEDIVYFAALEWKGRLHCETWEELFRKIFENKELLEKISEKETKKKNNYNMKWARDIDSRLSKRDREILENKEDILV